jgi:hypothetical protein
MKQISFGFFLVDEALKSYSEHFTGSSSAIGESYMVLGMNPRMG